MGATLKKDMYGVLAVLLLAGTISACTTAPSANVPSGQFQAQPPNLKTIAIVVTKSEEFSVRVSSEETNVTLPLVLPPQVGLLALPLYGIESAVRAFKDTATEAKLKPLVVNYDPRSTLTATVKRRLESAGHVVFVVSVDSQGNPALPAGKESDGILRVTLREWGLRSCIGRGVEERVQVGAVADVRLLLPDGEQIVWERERIYYLDTKCHTLAELQLREYLLKSAIQRTVMNFAERIANEVLFP